MLLLGKDLLLDNTAVVCIMISIMSRETENTEDWSQIDFHAVKKKDVIRATFDIEGEKVTWSGRVKKTGKTKKNNETVRYIETKGDIIIYSDYNPHIEKLN